MIIAVGMLIAEHPPHIYGPAARCKWNLRMGRRSASIYPASGWSSRRLLGIAGLAGRVKFVFMFFMTERGRSRGGQRDERGTHH